MRVTRSREVLNLPVNQIVPNPNQPREHFNEEELFELSQSIHEYGVLQPISVRQIGEQYELVMGERRLRASKLAGKETIPAIILASEIGESAVMALVENLQRVDLNFVEEAQGYQRLMRDHGFSQKEIAQRIGKNQSTVSNKVRILSLSPAVQDVLVQHNLTERHARALLKLDDSELQLKVLKQVVANELNVKKTEKLVETYLSLRQEKKKRKIRGMASMKIYVNTIKQAYQAILDSGLNADFSEKDQGDFIEVTVKIPKENVK